jgi:hypothetical protein
MQTNNAFSRSTLVRLLFAGAASLLFAEPAISQSAAQETTLYAFQGGADGGNPLGGLISDTEGALYGVSWAFNTPGNVFQLKPPASGQTAWTETVLANGVSPQGSLVFDQRGSLYGASLAGYKDYGTIFQLTPQADGQTPWTGTELWSFGGGADGAYPQSPLIFDTCMAQRHREARPVSARCIS